jgi:protocatechuate 3,4-dioxygenase beta subunit
LPNDSIYDLGLPADLAMWLRAPIARRRILRMGVAGIGLLLAGCSGGGPGAPPGGGGPGASSATRVSSSGSCVEVPSETNGPYPADGSNASNQSLNVLTRSGIVRSDIRTSLGTKNVAAGIPTTVEMTLINVNNNCAPLAGYALYIWHCDRAGLYSMYSNGVTEEDYCRGVQATDASGKATFQTIFPACYSGRWPHIHFEVYPSLDKATGPSNLLHTSQLAVPKDVCDTVYATDGYSASVRNLSQLTLATDNVFRDGSTSQLATVTGSVADGFNFKLTAGVYV